VLLGGRPPPMPRYSRHRILDLTASVPNAGTEANTHVCRALTVRQSTSTRVALTVPDSVNSTVLWSNSDPGTVGSNFDMY
jgi:hypothetical protein